MQLLVVHREKTPIPLVELVRVVFRDAGRYLLLLANARHQIPVRLSSIVTVAGDAITTLSIIDCVPPAAAH